MLTFEGAVFQQGSFIVSADFAVSEGGVTAVIGPSGAGKSTLLHGVAGFVPQVAGRTRVQGRDVTRAAPQHRPVSMLFQDNNLFPHLTVMQNVALALGPRLRPARDVRDRVEEMLDHVGLSGLSDRKPAGLSGGQQSRVALARALLQDRPVVLMDEPFSALGPALKDEMLDLSVSLAQGRTVVMITHDPADAGRIADAVIGVVPGRALPPVPTQTFLTDPPDEMRDYFSLL
ncbi:thiamine ABC transporter ATP-binding protein [Pseudooctadecabacter jejudonensis]|uniref:Thiamine import ATP-binding protein ThiQ n=1 Tax=Pseudooctadecabacter jejudonensis TaxID=1391910 RepID=A0A1Y5SC89_9RHOB|nr:ATP-binding cassette domain-containing protein [Pseudooctadecabacter jejudonensis]SLN34647.1 Thiamine import ATP-binding protein ThiQ [Pseudooctadecabacter jejudonensis]